MSSNNVLENLKMNTMIQNNSKIYLDYKKKIDTFIDEQTKSLKSYPFVLNNENNNNSKKTKTVEEKKQIIENKIKLMKKTYLNTYVIPLMFLTNAYVYTNYVNNIQTIFQNNVILNNFTLLDYFYSYKTPILKDFNICIYKNYYKSSNQKNNTLNKSIDYIKINKYGFNPQNINKLIDNLKKISTYLDNLNKPFVLLDKKNKIEESYDISAIDNQKKFIEKIMGKLISLDPQKKIIEDLKKLFDDIKKKTDNIKSGGGGDVINTNNSERIKKLEKLDTKVKEEFIEQFYDLIGYQVENKMISIIDLYNILQIFSKRIEENIEENIEEKNKKSNNSQTINKTIIPITFSFHEGGNQSNSFNSIKSEIDNLVELLIIYKNQFTSKNVTNKSKKSFFDNIKKSIETIKTEITSIQFNGLFENIYNNYVIFQLKLIFCNLDKLVTNDNHNIVNWTKLKENKVNFPNDFRKLLLTMKGLDFSLKKTYENLIQERMIKIEKYKKRKTKEQKELNKLTQKIKTMIISEKKLIYKLEKDIEILKDMNENLMKEIKSYFKNNINITNHLQSFEAGSINSLKNKIKNRHLTKPHAPASGPVPVPVLASGNLTDTVKNKLIGNKKRIDENKRKIESLNDDLKKEENKNVQKKLEEEKLEEFEKNMSYLDAYIEQFESQIKFFNQERSKNNNEFKFDSLKPIFMDFINSNIDLMILLESIVKNREISNKSDIFYFYYKSDKKLSQIQTLDENINNNSRNSCNNNQNNNSDNRPQNNNNTENETDKSKKLENIIKYIDGLENTKNKNVQGQYFYYKIQKDISSFQLEPQCQIFLTQFEKQHKKVIQSIQIKLKKIKTNIKKKNNQNNNNDELQKTLESMKKK